MAPRPRAFDETTALEQARGAFWRTGYAATTMDDIARATGLGKGSLYAAFGGKRELYELVFTDWCERILTRARAELSGPDDTACARLADYVRAMTEEVAGDTGHLGCLLAKTAAELSGVDQAVADRCAATINGVHAVLVESVTAAQRAGDLDPAVDPHALAAHVLVVLRGVEAVGKAGAGAATLRAATDIALSFTARPVPGAATKQV